MISATAHKNSPASSNSRDSAKSLAYALASSVISKINANFSLKFLMSSTFESLIVNCSRYSLVSL
jgi:hypothetical protein